MLGLTSLSYKVHKTTVIQTILFPTKSVQFSSDSGFFDGMFDFSKQRFLNIL